MPPTIAAVQAQRSNSLLNSPLTRDVIIMLQWQVDDEREEVLQQGCAIQLAPGYALAAQIDRDKRTYSFRLAKGTTLAFPLIAQVQTDLAARTAPPARVHVAGRFVSNDVEIRFPSLLVPEREAISTVYGELNQELRRTRTLYETFLGAVTVGLPTLYTKRDAIVAAYPYRRPILVGLGVLAATVVYMLWAVSRRYTRSVTWVANLEYALGVRTGDVPEDLMPDKAAWFTKHALTHTLWAFLLTWYVVVLVVSAGKLITTKPDLQKTLIPPAQTVCCDCIRPAPCTGDSTKAFSSTTKTAEPAPPKPAVIPNHKP